MKDMFLECENNGVFFIINDKESNVVSNFIFGANAKYPSKFLIYYGSFKVEELCG